VIGVLGPNIDHVVRTSIRDPRKADIWIKDQYFNPHETWHSMDEVLDWFDENGVRYQLPPFAARQQRGSSGRAVLCGLAGQ
jgi:hypothetical protein